MKFSFVIALGLAGGFAAAQSTQLDQIPKCAYGCVGSYITGNKIAGCATADIACVCSNKDFIGDISCCLEKVCGKDDIQATIRFAAGICNASGVKVPTQLVCNKNNGTTPTIPPTPTNGGTNTTAPSAPPTPSRTNGAASVHASAGGVLAVAVAVAALL